MTPSPRRLAFMAEAYRKDIILVEATENCRPAESRKSPAPYPESAEGRREFLEEVQRVVLATPHGLGKGVFDKYARGKVPARSAL